MSYQKAWKSEEYALKDLKGLTDESYTKLVRYYHKIEELTLTRHFFIETYGHNHFKYFFMNFGRFIWGFWNMMPLILVDSTILKARYKEKLIIVTCQDANI